MKINVVAVHVGDYCGRGMEYVQRLFEGVGQNIPKDMHFVPRCITDNPRMISEMNPFISTIEADQGAKGWWAKISMFRPGVFPAGERVLYFDLDTVITGDLSDIASYTGRFAALRDFYFKGNLNSAMMAWEAGTMDHIWRIWDRCGRPQFITGGDQAWIESVQPGYDQWQEMFPDQIFSYKLHCAPIDVSPDREVDQWPTIIPPNARVVCYHGEPRPHTTDLWK